MVPVRAFFAGPVMMRLALFCFVNLSVVCMATQQMTQMKVLYQRYDAAGGYPPKSANCTGKPSMSQTSNEGCQSDDGQHAVRLTCMRDATGVQVAVMMEAFSNGVCSGTPLEAPQYKDGFCNPADGFMFSYSCAEATQAEPSERKAHSSHGSGPFVV
mmetsp:Transcript_49257/g.86710  ORF Transcript_49257/g.86710 Transcript_49257/m.86710 type:complete len:157 (-) Transcript_49257:11-481(-)